MSQKQLACVLSIAGTDPSGGAGIQADLKAISATGAYAANVITALVAQNTQGVQFIQGIPAEFVIKQLDSVFSDLTIHAVKIGMLHDARIIQVMGDALQRFKPPNVVFDPVMVAKDGSALLAPETIELLKTQIIRQTHLITPNVFEAEQLIGQSIQNMDKMKSAAIHLGKQFQANVLLKGGHLQGVQSADVLYRLDDGNCYWFNSKRIQTKNTHGTGCSLSAAIASYLGQGLSLVDAVKSAKQYLTKAIQAGKELSIGKGNGPVDHFYFLRANKYDLS